MSFVNNLRSLLGGVSVEAPKETFDEKMFREYIRDLNTPKILPPDEYVDPYAIVWEGKGNRYGKKQQ